MRFKEIPKAGNAGKVEGHGHKYVSRQEGVISMKRLSMKKALCLLSAVALILTAGCGNQNSKVGDSNSDSSPDGMQESNIGDGNVSMGRYAEEEIDLTKELAVVSGMKKMPDGKLVRTDTTSGIWE